MSAQTVIRVKRRRDETPLDALLLACKRQKCEESDAQDDELQVTVKLAGTVEKPDEISLNTALLNVKAAKKLREDKLQHVSDVRDKLRQDAAKKWKDKRYEVVSKFRSDNVEGSQETPITVLDIESKTGETEEEGDDFLYDVYYTTDVFDGVMESILSIQPVDLVNEEMEDDDGENVSEESDDSNDENNWRNDYPDEDEDRCFESADSEDDNEFGWRKPRKKRDSDDDEEISLSSEDFDDDYLYGQTKTVDGLIERWHDALAPTDSEDEV